MTEVMEKVAVIAGLEIEWKCPFSHDEDADDYENDFIGTGAKLGKKLETGRPTSNNPVRRAKRATQRAIAARLAACHSPWSTCCYWRASHPLSRRCATPGHGVGA